MDKILVSLDGSESSMKALEQAAEIASKFSSTLILLHVVSNVVDSAYLALNDYKQAIDQAFEDTGKKILEEASESVDRNIKVKTILEHGDPGKLIMDTAKKEGVDLLVMGNRGLTPISRVMLGSVSNKVLNNTKCSVLIVK